MPVNDALKFINEFRANHEFRAALNSLNTRDELSRFLQWNGYNFSNNEFEDGLRSLLLKCGDEDEADEVKEIGMWYKLQRGIR